MLVFIKLIKDDEKFPIEVDSETTIYELKLKI